MESGIDGHDPNGTNLSSGEKSLSVPPGSSRLEMKLELQPGTCLEVTLESRTPEGEVLERHTLSLSNPAGGAAPVVPAMPAIASTHPQSKIRERLNAGLRSLSFAWQAWLFGGALGVYLLTRLVGLANFPIYFFTDEAVQTVLASDLVRDHFFGYGHELLPTFFPNGNQYNLSTSVYLQVIPYILFDRSIWITRGVAVLMTLFAAWSVGRILKDIYHSSYAWTAVLLLSITPAWFLHSRTAFETALATSFYAWFLYLYMMYRCVSPRYLYGTIAVGALTFYSYSPAQMYMLVTAALLLVSDARYHWQQRKLLISGLGLAILLALPYVRFQVNHPNENLKHLQILSSYWIENKPFTEKLAQFGSEYLRGLDPTYWFLPNGTDFTRHRMDGYGHLLRLSLPLVFGGLVLAIKKIKSSPNRTILAALIAAPSGAAIASLGVTRALVMVIPAALLAALGLSAFLGWLERFKLPRLALTLPVFALLAGFNVYMLNDALVNGPTWFRDYGLGGMQWGARQVFSSVFTEVRDHPNSKVTVSPSWANGTDVVARFFYGDSLPFYMGSIDSYIVEKKDLSPDDLFVMIPDEMKAAAQSGKFKQIRLEKVLDYPDGTPGFYFAHLQYADNINALFSVEAQSRRAMKDEETQWNGQTVSVRYPALDMGQVKDAFDGDDRTILRTAEANPLTLDIALTKPRSIERLGARVGGAPQRVTFYIYEKDRERPLVFSQEVRENPEPRDVTFTLPRPVQTARIRLEVLSIYDQEPAHVHLWEVKAWP